MENTPASRSSPRASGAAAAQSFADLFPPLVSAEPTPEEREVEAQHGSVDLSVDDLVLRPLEQEVERHLYEALQRWNRRVPASSETTLGYMQRLKRYRAVVRWLLYENEDAHLDDEGALPTSSHRDPSPNAQRRAAKQQKKLRRAQIAMYTDIFDAMPPIATLRELRRPSARIHQFLEQFPAKKKIQQTKRSVADTQTSMSFEFARRPPTAVQGNPHGSAAEAARGSDTDSAAGEETDKVQRPTATTAATWRSRTLLASMETQHAQQQTASSGSRRDLDHELVLWIDVLHASKDPARTQSFLVLGSQTLSELLDLVACAYDQRFEAHARQSKLLYFDRQFYVDRRHEKNVDYSLEILMWMYANPKRVAQYLPPLQNGLPVPKPLETTTFAELALKIDVPGVYIHQGECEHLVRLRDVRLLDETTDATANRTDDFPMRLPNSHQRQLRSCLVCSNYSAKFITYGDRMAASDPMFYCERCFRAAHYGSDGTLLFTDFEAFPYIQE